MDILLRLRTYKVALVTDIEKAFLQISVVKRDRDVLRFLWIDDTTKPDPEIVVLHFTRVPFGVTSSPFLLDATLQHPVHDNLQRHCTEDVLITFMLMTLPLDLNLSQMLIPSTVKHSLYSRKEVFNLRKFITNSTILQEAIDNAEGQQSIDQPHQPCTMVLSVQWDLAADVFVLDLKDIAIKAQGLKATKGTVIGIGSKFYDPVGFLSPITIRFKILFQRLCQANLQWDDMLSDNLLPIWQALVNDLRSTAPITIPRYYLDETQIPLSCSLFGFLFFGNFQLLSCTGVQQGDPLGPLCFALTLHPLIEQIQFNVPNLCLNAWYLDDGSLSGLPNALFSALEPIDTAGPSRGLHLNKSKCLFSISNEANFDLGSFPAGIPITLDGFTLLGCPIDPPSFCLNSILKRIGKVQSLFARLPDLHDSQIECALLRSCLSLPKIAFALRTCPPDFIYPALTVFDNLIREALSQLAGSTLSNWSWSKASLPSSLGGINLRQAVLHAPAAYIGSLHQSCPLVSEILGFQPSYPTSLPSVVRALGSTLGHPEWSELSDIGLSLRQRSLSLVIDLSGHS